MNYSTLPALVFDELFSYLSVKDRIKCKAVCRSWKRQVELKDKNRDSLIVHVGFYPLNEKWCWANNKGLMRFENSFQVKDFSFLILPLTKLHFKSLKKVHLADWYSVHAGMFYDRFHLCIGWLVNCEVLEICGITMQSETVFDLPKLKVLVLKNTKADHLVLDSRLLEVLVLCGRIQRIDWKRTNRIRHLECMSAGTLDCLASGKFPNLECFNLFDGENMEVRPNLFKDMPKLKKFIYYSLSISQPAMQKLKEQRKQLGLHDLKILAAGFDDEENAEIAISANQDTFTLNELNVDFVCENYAKLVEPCVWDVCHHYNDLFAKFRLLPCNFFDKFPVNSLIVRRATSDPHLFAFLKHCPALFLLRISFSQTRPLLLDQLFVLTPSLRELTLNEDEGSPVASLDLTFLRNLKLNYIGFVCSGKGSTKFSLKIFRFQHPIHLKTTSVRFLIFSILALPTKFIADAFKYSRGLCCLNFTTHDYIPDYQFAIYLPHAIKKFVVVHNEDESNAFRFSDLGPAVDHLKRQSDARYYLI